MKVLYTVFNTNDHEDLSVYYEHEHAKLFCEHYNASWIDDQGVTHTPTRTYEMGAETFRDEEWPTVLRVLNLCGVTVKIEKEQVEEMKAAEELHKKAQANPIKLG